IVLIAVIPVASVLIGDGGKTDAPFVHIVASLDEIVAVKRFLESVLALLALESRPRFPGGRRVTSKRLAQHIDTLSLQRQIGQRQLILGTALVYAVLGNVVVLEINLERFFCIVRQILVVENGIAEALAVLSAIIIVEILQL